MLTILLQLLLARKLAIRRQVCQHLVVLRLQGVCHKAGQQLAQARPQHKALAARTHGEEKAVCLFRPADDRKAVECHGI